MLSREDFFMIKQMRRQGAYIVDIATQIGCSERTVRRYLRYPSPPARKARLRMEKLRPFMEYIDMRLTENVWNAEVIFHEIRKMGYPGGRTTLRAYIQPKRKMRPGKKTVRFETQPGYQLQHDWGEIEAEVAGGRCKINFAVNTLGYSRRLHVFAAPSQDAEHTYESLVRAFRYFGGGVKTVPDAAFQLDPSTRDCWLEPSVPAARTPVAARHGQPTRLDWLWWHATARYA